MPITIWWSGWETLPQSGRRAQYTVYTVRYSVLRTDSRSNNVKICRIEVVPFGPQFIGGPGVLEQEKEGSNRDISNTLCTPKYRNDMRNHRARIE